MSIPRVTSSVMACAGLLAVIAATPAPLLAQAPTPREQTEPKKDQPPIDRWTPAPKPRRDGPDARQPPQKRAQPEPPKADPEAERRALARPQGQRGPQTPLDRARALSDLYARLATTEDDTTAQLLQQVIERVWQSSGSDTINVLMERAANAINEKKYDLAEDLLDFVTELAPDYPEGFGRRAVVFMLKSDYGRALGDIRRVLAMDPSHFRALDTFAQIMKETGRKKAALAGYRKLLEVHPHYPGAKQAIEELARDVDGQGI